MNNLEKYEIEDMNSRMQEEVTRFKVDNLESANWCFRKMRALKTAMDENKALAEAEHKRINEWLEKANAEHQQAYEFFELEIMAYYREMREQNKKFKLQSPYGKVSSRKSSKWLYEEDKLLKWLKDNNISDIIRVKEEINKLKVKELFPKGIDTHTGELVDGVTIEEVESFTVKVEEV